MSNYVDLPVTFKRLSPDPLESNSSFNTLASLLNYANSDVSYAGQVCSCIETNSLYIISSDKTLNLVKSTESYQFYSLWKNFYSAPTYKITSSNGDLIHGISMYPPQESWMPAFNSLLVSNLSSIATFSSNSNVGGVLNVENCVNLLDLNCQGAGIYSLEGGLTNCSKLTSLNCSNNLLNDLSAHNKPVLKVVDCSNNTYLSYISIHNAPLLVSVAGRNISSSSINISLCPTLTSIDLTTTNQNLQQTLNFTNIPLLKTLLVNRNNVTQISWNGVAIPLNFASLSGFNNLQTLVVTNTNVPHLTANQLSILNSVNISYTGLSAISFSNCPISNLVVNNEPNLTPSSIDALIKERVDSNVFFGTLDLSVGVSGPTCLGEPYVDVLRSRGWTVTHGPVAPRLPLFLDGTWTDNVVWVDCSPLQ